MKTFNRGIAIALAATALGAGALVAQAAPAKHAAKPAVVRINSASVAQLETLPGVGPKLAAQIVRHRPYRNAAALESKVKGIGPKLWSQNARRVSFR